MKEPYRVEVDGCGSCPFTRYRRDGWFCTVIDKLYTERDGAPDWCPLRAADHLVTLRVK